MHINEIILAFRQESLKSTSKQPQPRTVSSVMHCVVLHACLCVTFVL